MYVEHLAHNMKIDASISLSLYVCIYIYRYTHVCVLYVCVHDIHVWMCVRKRMMHTLVLIMAMEGELCWFAPGVVLCPCFAVVTTGCVKRVSFNTYHIRKLGCRTYGLGTSSTSSRPRCFCRCLF